MDPCIAERAEAYVRELFAKDFSGHDFDHTMRVVRIAEKLATEEGAELLPVRLAALLHDADDRKLSPETCAEKLHARTFLRENGAEEADISRIVKIIEEVSFLGSDSVTPSSIEGRCVQDADRLDAIGAVGVARAFAYGGSHHRVMHDPKIPPVLNMDGETYSNHISTTINHFYEKLLLLPSMMTTASGRRMAAERDQFLRGFLAEFLAEWDGKR